MINYFKL